jgi:poly-gamma-glutamate capsule biosynthesis protein CapA/YwtB (metallophosphatase superfamily)
MIAIALTGDVMLGRLIDRYIWRDRAIDPAYVWGDTRDLLLAHDLRLVNLECVIAAGCDQARRARKPFTFCAGPRAVEALLTAHVDLVSLANNHVLDFGPQALGELLDLLDGHGIAHTGAGRSDDEAMRPAVLQARPAGDPEGLTVSVIGLTDNEPTWEAGPGRPGVHFVDYDRQGLKEPFRRRLAGALAAARQVAGLVIVSAHVGPNWGEPSPEMQALAHQLIDLGADLYWGHSNHTTGGIERYGGRPILYSTGDFVDDYAVDPYERNDLSFLFRLEVEAGCIRRLRLYPVKISQLQVNLAPPAGAIWLRSWMRARCAPYGTTLDDLDGTLVLAVD